MVNKVVVPCIIDRNVNTPAYATPDSAGIDLHANIESPLTIKSGERGVLVGTGVRLRIEDNRGDHVFLLLPRSGLGHKHGLTLSNDTGVIDGDYTGEIMASLIVKQGYPDYTINPNDRIAQLVAVPISRMQLVEYVEPTETKFSTDLADETNARNDGGFGSTGK